jgi:hypothetical protein
MPCQYRKYPVSAEAIMKTDAVIGCDAVDAGAEWLRLKTATGATRTIPWSAIKLGGMGHKLEGHVTIQGVTEKVAPLLATHDPLWIVYAEGGFAQVMIEKISPKRDALLAAFAQHLGDRWQGDELEGSDLMGAMIPAKVRFPKMLIVILAAIAIIFFAAMAMIFFTHGAKPTAP